ncbi:MAG: UDP-N-acetylmuramoyl-tripeptide--D-alanyl-D-alanine ligase [Bacteroidales bacterium]|jgi:UDP-N-acetylmuramoyl-tripeptide--D-alanyl-D-alanine ligase|nr:UDP-N-acetylmuramoyl-tripeptide--D-alanyl-D-alanine ligase [Bacteroidales bacterium]
MIMDIERLYELYRSSSGITTDSRSAGRNQIFFALRGPNHDGNRHAIAALEAGALAAVVDDRSLSGEKMVFVDDVLETLTALAAFHRRRLTVPVIAVTGTNGKTTTKELLTAVLSRKGKVHSTSGNLNNHIGVPLTLLSAPGDAMFLVVEMGANHRGEIAALCDTAMPTHGIITNIGTAHIEGFGSFDNVREAKSELYLWLGESRGTAIYDDDNPVLNGIISLAYKAVPYSSPAGHEMKVVPADGDSMHLAVNAVVDGHEYLFKTALFGSYNIDNIRTAMATGLFFDVPVAEIIDAVSAYCPANNRSQVVDTGNNIVIRDAYNANPSSMEKAITSFAAIRSEKKMVILGDMLELGSESETGHAAVIRQLSGLGQVSIVLVGPRFRKAAGGFSSLLFGSSTEAAEWLGSERPRGYTVLVKGSRGMMLEKVFPLL